MRCLPDSLMRTNWMKPAKERLCCSVWLLENQQIFSSGRESMMNPQKLSTGRDKLPQIRTSEI